MEIRKKIYKSYIKSLEHERITELRLKKWENKWPYEWPQGENLDDIINNAELKGLNRAIGRYESKLTEDLEEILLTFYNNFLEYDQDKAASFIAKAWKNRVMKSHEQTQTQIQISPK